MQNNLGTQKLESQQSMCSQPQTGIEQGTADALEKGTVKKQVAKIDAANDRSKNLVTEPKLVPAPEPEPEPELETLALIPTSQDVTNTRETGTTSTPLLVSVNSNSLKKPPSPAPGLGPDPDQEALTPTSQDVTNTQETGTTSTLLSVSVNSDLSKNAQQVTPETKLGPETDQKALEEKCKNIREFSKLPKAQMMCAIFLLVNLSLFSAYCFIRYFNSKN